MNRIIILTFFVLFAGCGNHSFEWGEPRFDANDISIFELITNGEKFDGWRVRVSGTGIIQFESHLLFVSNERYQKFDTSSSIKLDIEPEELESNYSDLNKFTGSWYLIEGIYIHQGREELPQDVLQIGSDYPGILTKINRISIYD
ncbi:hypothetical protein NBRC116493_35980 [Aurantivibrio infirmus]